MPKPSIPAGDALRFEALGHDESFGLARLHFGREGGNLFRRARLRPDQLLTLLHFDFDRMFEETALVPLGGGLVREARYGIVWRSDLPMERTEEGWRFAGDDLVRQDVHRRETRQLAGLRRRFLDRLRGGGVICTVEWGAGVEPALLDMIEAELTRLAGGAPFWLLELRRPTETGAAGRLDILSERRLCGHLDDPAGDEPFDAEVYGRILRQALNAASFPRWAAVSALLEERVARPRRILPFPQKAEAGAAEGLHDFDGGRVRLLNGHHWSRQVDGQFLIHASEPDRPRTALEWSDLRLAGSWRVATQAIVAIDAIAPMQLELAAFRGDTEIGRAECPVTSTERTGELSLIFPAGAEEGLRLVLTARTLEPLPAGERSVVRLKAPMLRAVEPDEAARSEAEWLPVAVPAKGDERLFRRRVISAPRSWTKTVPGFVLDLSGRDVDVSRLYAAERHPKGCAVDTFEEATVLGFDGILKDDAYFNRYDVHAAKVLRGIAAAHGTYQNRATELQLREDRVVLPLDILEEAEFLDERIFLGTPDEPDNWGMWLLLGIPGMREFLDNRERYDRFLCELRHPWQRALLHTVGLKDEDILEHRRGTAYRCREVSTLRKDERDMIVSSEEYAMFRGLAERLAAGATAPAPERIFISRLSRTRKQGAYRGLTNEEELIAALEPLGFTAVEPELLPFAEQVALFAKARFVVGLGGAAMFNTIFCRPETKVVTIESTAGFLDAHTNIFASLGLSYGVILGEEDLSDPRGSQRRWRLDVARAVAGLSQML